MLNNDRAKIKNVNGAMWKNMLSSGVTEKTVVNKIMLISSIPLEIENKVKSKFVTIDIKIPLINAEPTSNYIACQ